MGKRGPKPQPTALKKARGNPGRRKLNDQEPQPHPLTPPRPGWLEGLAAEAWEDLAPMLARLGVLTEADGIALGLLCDAIGDYCAARDELAADAKDTGSRFVIYTEKGNAIQHPTAGVMTRAWERVLKAAREFGLTPSSRSGLKISFEVTQKKESDGLLPPA